MTGNGRASRRRGARQAARTVRGCSGHDSPFSLESRTRCTRRCCGLYHRMVSSRVLRPTPAALLYYVRESVAGFSLSLVLRLARCRRRLCHSFGMSQPAPLPVSLHVRSLDQERRPRSSLRRLALAAFVLRLRGRTGSPAATRLAVLHRLASRFPEQVNGQMLRCSAAVLTVDDMLTVVLNVRPCDHVAVCVLDVAWAEAAEMVTQRLASQLPRDALIAWLPCFPDDSSPTGPTLTLYRLQHDYPTAPWGSYADAAGP